jgi:hypothetical protein
VHALRSLSAAHAGPQKRQAPARRDAEGNEVHADAEREPLQRFPDDVNPNTQERGGPRGREPTRYGDWERKGRTFDF